MRLEQDLLEIQNNFGDIFADASMVANSCMAPSTLMEVMAAPSSEDSSTRRRELPIVWP